MRISIAILFFALSSAAWPALVAADSSQDFDSAAEEAAAADVKLNSAYRDLLKLESPPPGMAGHHAQAKKSLILAQRAWLQFRDKDCAAVFDIADGTSKAALSVTCEAEHAAQRVNQLRDMANGL